jgi:hypothetical protein
LLEGIDNLIRKAVRELDAIIRVSEWSIHPIPKVSEYGLLKNIEPQFRAALDVDRRDSGFRGLAWRWFAFTEHQLRSFRHLRHSQPTKVETQRARLWQPSQSVLNSIAMFCPFLQHPYHPVSHLARFAVQARGKAI